MSDLCVHVGMYYAPFVCGILSRCGVDPLHSCPVTCLLPEPGLPVDFNLHVCEASEGRVRTAPGLHQG